MEITPNDPNYDWPDGPYGWHVNKTTGESITTRNVNWLDIGDEETFITDQTHGNILKLQTNRGHNPDCGPARYPTGIDDIYSAVENNELVVKCRHCNWTL